MKNVIKLAAVATVVSTAAFAQVGTDWTSSDVNYDNIFEGASKSAFTNAAADLEDELKGASHFTPTGLAKNEDTGNWELTGTTETIYSNKNIGDQITLVRSAMEDDFFGTDIIADFDINENAGGIFGAAADDIQTDLSDLITTAATVSANYKTGDATKQDVIDLMGDADDIVESLDALNSGLAAFNTAYDLLVALDDYTPVEAE